MLSILLYDCYTLRRETTYVPPRTRIVGALSDGHIIESGDNANGEYIRFADGTQVCWGTTPELSLQFQAYGSIFQASYVITFPAEFVDVDISCAASVTVGTGAPWANIQTPTVSLVTIRVFDIANRTNVLKTVFRWFAIGKWK